MAKAKGKSADQAAIDGGWEGKALVMCEDGPRAGAWYFLDDAPRARSRPASGSWLDLRRLARWHGESTSTGQTLGYVTAGRVAQHRLNGREAEVLVWAPTEAERRSHAGPDVY